MTAMTKIQSLNRRWARNCGELPQKPVGTGCEYALELHHRTDDCRRHRPILGHPRYGFFGY
jgi:hypothetical protein